MKSYEEALLVDASSQALRRTVRLRLTGASCITPTHWSLQHHPDSLGHHHPDPLGHHHPDLLGHHHPDSLGHHHPDSLGHHHPDSLGHHRRQFRLTENYADTGSDSLEPAALLRLTGALQHRSEFY
ncbi:hypothetical protein PYW07_000335 [Mythimna separata]|uniref:Uncharacterized protein n=1 Tax=Mythimna separata TaxID=271217 RepID=A0AAD8E0Y0_MYTSE|nr:hypothetical protein PYW07_000335 [Mythimna separata]